MSFKNQPPPFILLLPEYVKKEQSYVYPIAFLFMVVGQLDLKSKKRKSRA
jgi:hypothetical protein